MNTPFFVFFAVVTIVVSSSKDNDQLEENFERKLSQALHTRNNEKRSTYRNGVFEQDTVRIGALISLTGPAGYIGKVIKPGIEKSVKDMCSSGDSGSCAEITVEYHDTQSSPRIALELFRELYERDIKIFIGLVTSDEAKAVAEYAASQANDALLISPSSTASELCSYSQLYRIAMDDQGLAQVLYDMSLEMKEQFSAGIESVSVQLIHRNDLRSKGLSKDISDIFKEKKGEEVVSISYNPDNLMATDLISKLDESLNGKSDRELSMIVLNGMVEEAEEILKAATDIYDSRNQMWILTDTLALSDIQVPAGFKVYGLHFRGTEQNNRRLKKELHGLLDSLHHKGLPPMSQALLAYDATSIVYDLIKKRKHTAGRDYFSDNMVSEGITGAATDFSSCHERSSGEYEFTVNIADDNLLQGVVAKKWMVVSHYMVTERDDKNFAIMHDMEVKANKGSVSSLPSAVATLTRSDVLKNLYSSTNCNENVSVIVSTLDETSNIHISSTYSINTIPEVITIPAKYGFIVTGICWDAMYENKIVDVCSPASVAGTEITCTSRISKTRLNRGLVYQQGVAEVIGAATTTCIVGSSICYAITFNKICGLTLASCAVFQSVTVVPLPTKKPTVVPSPENEPTEVPLPKKKKKDKKKYVCTELFRQGHMSAELMLADMSFALQYTKDHPIIRQGYDVLGPAVASLMQKSETVTNIAKYIAIPWAEEMAYEVGYRETGNDFGGWVMSVGSVICGFVGVVYIYWNTIGILFGTLFAIVIMALLVLKKYPKHFKTD